MEQIKIENTDIFCKADPSVVSKVITLKHDNIMECFLVSEETVRLDCVDGTLESYIALKKFTSQDKIPLIFQLLCALKFLEDHDIHFKDTIPVYVSDKKIKVFPNGNSLDKEETSLAFGKYILSLFGGFSFIETIKDEAFKNSLKSFIKASLTDTSVRKSIEQLLKDKLFDGMKIIEGVVKDSFDLLTVPALVPGPVVGPTLAPVPGSTTGPALSTSLAPVSALASAPVSALASAPVSALASAPVSALASAPVSGLTQQVSRKNKSNYSENLKDLVKAVSLMAISINMDTRTYCIAVDVLRRMESTLDKVEYLNPVRTPEIIGVALYIAYNGNVPFDILEVMKQSGFTPLGNLNKLDKYIEVYRENNAQLYSTQFYEKEAVGKPLQQVIALERSRLA